LVNAQAYAHGLHGLNAGILTLTVTEFMDVVCRQIGSAAGRLGAGARPAAQRQLTHRAVKLSLPIPVSFCW
jgi:hypothetical protein